MLVKVYIKNVTSPVSVVHKTQDLDGRANRKHTQDVMKFRPYSCKYA